MKESIKKTSLKFPPVFIVGSPRSGTTLLRNLLAAHPKAISFPESKFFQYLAKYQRYGFVHPKMRMIVAKFISRLPQNYRDHIDSEVPLLFPRTTWVRYLVGLLNQMMNAEGKDFWIEKTPEHLQQIPLIKGYLPGSRFIHIERNPPDVIASMYERSRTKWQNPFSIDQCINYCRRNDLLHEQYKGKKNHIFVSYEMICENTVEELKKLCMFLKIDFCERIHTDYLQMQFKIDPFSTGRFHQKLMRPIQNQNGQTFSRIFSLKEQQYILNRLENLSGDKK